jgi:hypothetical protein
MNQIARRSAIAALLVCSAALPARADVAADLQQKIDAAMRNAKSFVVTTLYPAQAYSSTLVYVAPNRSRVAVAIAASTTDVVTVGDTSYSSKNGAPFEKAAVLPEESARLKSIGSVKVETVRADITTEGATYGAFETSVPLGSAVTLTCTYDKKSFRLARCANGEVTQTYKNYDDPNNTVETPTNFVDVPKGGK